MARRKQPLISDALLDLTLPPCDASQSRVKSA